MTKGGGEGKWKYIWKERIKSSGGFPVDILKIKYHSYMIKTRNIFNDFVITIWMQKFRNL